MHIYEYKSQNINRYFYNVITKYTLSADVRYNICSPYISDIMDFMFLDSSIVRININVHLF